VSHASRGSQSDSHSNSPTARRSTASSAREPSRGGPARAIGDVLPAALRGMGLPSRAQARRVFDAWARVADASWGSRAAPVSIQRGTLIVGVSSASLREDLVQFHAERLLGDLKRLLPADRVIAVRFVAAGEDSK
jgi:hypothetical protein